jgi:8-oxo-dGTP diphosphatase
MKKTSHYSQTLDSLHVAVGVIKNPKGEILISQRAAKAHQGGLWEFPGGKVEKGESVMQALRRELKEELGIKVKQCEPLIRIHHDYPDLSVLLDVWTVEKFGGVAHGREGQAVRWVVANELANYEFPVANLPIIHAAQLPGFYAILDDVEPMKLMANLNKILAKGIKLVQARLKNLFVPAVIEFIEQALPLCQQYQAQLLINSSAKRISEHFDLGLHLTGYDLMQMTERPHVNGWLAASCHNLAELKQAEKIGVDFVVLAPVLNTPTHPDAVTLGWELFAEFVEQVNIPVYALGGVSIEDKDTAKALGGQGIAGIRTFLS